MKTLPKFKIRASAASQIMTNGRSKDSMGQTCITYLENWVKEQIYQKRKELTTPAIMKGTLQEDSAIELLSQKHGFMVKNEQHFEDEYFTGTPDIITDIVRDTKCSQDCFTFPLFETELKKDYYWQMQVYLHLTNKSKASVDYVLVNAPEYQIEREARMRALKYGIEEVDEDFYNEVKDSMSYDDTPLDFRIKSFEVDYDINAIEALINRVNECRNYINQNLIINK
jgi:hypothetical protein